MIDRNDVTIVIPHLGGTKESEYSLDQCIVSLEETEPDIKRLLVKNGDKCLEHRAHIRMTPQGQCKAVNAAVAIANTPWIMVTNDDMIYPPGWWEKLTGGVLGIGLNPDSPTCISPQLVEPRQGAPTFLTQFFGGAGGDFNKPKFIEFTSIYTGLGIRTGFNLPFLIKKELWDLVGGYDVNYDPWGSNSDSDLLYKIRLAGIQPYQNQNCLIYHFSQTSGTFESQNQSYWQKNFAYFKDKWGFDRTDNRIWEADFVMPDKERIFRPEWEGKHV